MRTLLLTLALAGMVTAIGLADDSKPAKVVKKKDATKKKAEITLKVGDKAPALKASKWLQGDEIKGFEPGRVYVVEFWATWCGPCIVMMPHLGDLQEEFKNKGVTILGYSAKDPNNNEKKVSEFVDKRGPKLGYTFAYADDRDTYSAWMGAAGRNGIPCSFVIDKAGKIAYIGHPMYLDVVLSKVVDGTWKAKEGEEEMKKLETEVNAVFRGLNGKDALKVITEFEKKHPELSKIPYFLSPKMTAMLKEGKTNDVRKMAVEVMERAEKRDDVMALRAVSAALRSPAAKGNQDMLAMSLKAANTMVKIAGEKDLPALLNLADVQAATGAKDKAKETLKKAIENAPQPRTKELLEKRLKALEDKKEDE